MTASEQGLWVETRRRAGWIRFLVGLRQRPGLAAVVGFDDDVVVVDGGGNGGGDAVRRAM